MIYICIPTHNEQQTVGVVLWKLRQVLTEFPRDYQLLVADDASTDKTMDVLEPYTRVLPLTVIRAERQQGWAASMEMLLREAVRRSEYPKRDVIVTLQADFSEEPDDVVALIKRMEAGADVAVGLKVSVSKETRTRRFARSLSRFFTRRESWPEGVATPFDGYRAYRLHAVKRAIEDRQGRRLIRYDGWAGQAELLRSVLPHARRVDALDVEDRTDRMQRPRRERPLASAWQVRAMASGAEPTGLLSVDELDRIAATASRSRDRALSVANGRASRSSNGRGNGETAQRRDQRGDRSRSGGRADRPRAGGERPGSDRPRAGRPERTERPERPDRAARGERTQRGEARKTAGESRPRQRREPPGERTQKREPRAVRDEAAPEVVAAAEAIDELLGSAGLEGASTTAEEAAPKKRRRRRRSRAAGSTDGPQGETSNDPNNGSAAEVLSGEGAETTDGEGAAPKKRRRRGGRRGGRGRRRSGAETADGSAEGSAESGVEDGVPVGRVEPAAGEPNGAREDREET